MTHDDGMDFTPAPSHREQRTAYRVTVQGHLEFPVHVLTALHAWPVGGSDSKALYESHHCHQVPRQIELYCLKQPEARHFGFARWDIVVQPVEVPLP